MFELSVACKYLVPRWRQLSVSIISLVSTLVIALVVWLIVVFFSVKDGLESSWIDKIVALTAPIRVTPTEKYYNSYYYLADSISSSANYTSKSIGEKLAAIETDPYDPSIDEEIPSHWLTADRNPNGEIKDLVKLAFASSANLYGLKHLTVTEYETTMANIRLRLLRHGVGTNSPSQQFLEHASYIGTFDAGTPALAKALVPPTANDFYNLLHIQSVSTDNIQEDSPEAIKHIDPDLLQQRLVTLFQTIEIKSLKTPIQGWRLPIKLLPKNGELVAAAIMKDTTITRLIIPNQAAQLPKLLQQLATDGMKAAPAAIRLDNGTIKTRLFDDEYKPLSNNTMLILEGNTLLPATLKDPLTKVKHARDIKFHVHASVQNLLIDGTIALGKLDIGETHILSTQANTLFATAQPDGINMPSNLSSEPVLLPKVFKETGALLGDHGYLSYFSPTPSTVQEQRIPVYVAGFYDPGIMPIGGKYILAGKELTALIRSSYAQDPVLASNGINVRFDNLSDSAKAKVELLEAFKKAGIDPYWHVETYQEFEFTRDLIQQLNSEKNLFSLISLIIIIVACSNIISMLIILVNDKKLEIGILRSMGATSGSIAIIFGICGMVMGAAGSLIGSIAAIFTLRYVNELVGLISSFQGYDLFNPVFYGHTLPTELSMEALTFVIITTAGISLLAGIVPALKASMLRPSAILRAE